MDNLLSYILGGNWSKKSTSHAGICLYYVLKKGAISDMYSNEHVREC